MLKYTKSPVIIIGMHRSGTSFLSRILDEAGCFMGADLESNHETITFIKINRWILEQYGSRWDNPEALAHLPKNTDLYERNLQEHVEWLLHSSIMKNYFGDKRYKILRKKDPVDFVWGWKDPRNILTLPIWLKIFPDAKIINVRRHGVDVAQSLVVRGKNLAENSIEEWTQRRNKKNKNPWNVARTNDSFSHRCLELEGALSLWDQYNQLAQKHILNSHTPVLDLQYENLLSQPSKYLEEILTFCNLDPADHFINKIEHSMDSTRCFAYKASTELTLFAKENSSILDAHGYPASN